MIVSPNNSNDHANVVGVNEWFEIARVLRLKGLLG